MWCEYRNEENSIEQNKAAYNQIQILLKSQVDVPKVQAGTHATLSQEIDLS